MLETLKIAAERHPRLGMNVGVSIDYLGADHDHHRGLEGCFEGCERIIEGIREMRSHHGNIMVCANGTYTKDNASSLLETAKTIMERHKIPFSIGLVRGDIHDEALKDISIAHYYETAREVLRLQRACIPATTLEAPIRFALEDMAVDNIYRSVVEDREVTKCQAGRRAVVLESSGGLRLCEILPDSFGNVRDHDYNIPALLERPESRALIEKVWQDRCHCTWECYNRASLAFDRRKWPELLVKTLGKAWAARR
jgi:sulfatase maturation enzyme AslB (radical SAM superfamily)